MEVARSSGRKRKARKIAMPGRDHELGSLTAPVGVTANLERAMGRKRSRDFIGEIEGEQCEVLVGCGQENHIVGGGCGSVEGEATGWEGAGGCWAVERIDDREKSERELSQFCINMQSQICSTSQIAKQDVASKEAGDLSRLESVAVVKAGTRRDSLLENAQSVNANLVGSNQWNGITPQVASTEYCGSDQEFSSAARMDEEKGNLRSLTEEAKGDTASVQKFGEPIPGACEALMAIADNLVAGLAGLKFASPVTCVYNPLVYARELYEQYVVKHGGRRVEVLLIGMNPGPFGMAQTGVPFGDSKLVQEFHGITGKVGSPEHLHLKRPIYGLQCPRQEVSGQRLWGWARDSFGSATNFFKHFWVYNYCPLAFMEASGKNRTPDKLQPVERSNVKAVCGKSLIQTISLLQPRFAVGIGKYAADRVRECGVPGVKIGEIMHPSPANPKANKNWAKIIESQLQNLGVDMLDRNT